MIGSIIVSNGKEEKKGEILFIKEDGTFGCKFFPSIEDPLKTHLSYFDSKTGFKKVFKCGRIQIDNSDSGYKIVEYSLKVQKQEL